MAFSYTLDWRVPFPPNPQAGGRIFYIGGSFTDCQAAGSAMALGTNQGVSSIKYFHATNLTDTDEEVKVAISGTTVTISVGSNDDDGQWEAIVLY